jgi:hypothetical protein
MATGPARLLGEGHDFLGALQGLPAPGHPFDAGPLGSEARGDLVAHDVDRLGRGSDEGDPARGDGAREIGVFREEVVAGYTASAPLRAMMSRIASVLR